jgi:replication factor C subunit 1
MCRPVLVSRGSEARRPLCRYKPRKARDLVGNFQAAQKLSQWISKWSPVRGSGVRSVLLSGPPGIGKTSMAHCIVRDCGFDLLEFNASDVRSKKAVANQIQAVTGNRSMSEFFGGASSGTKKVALIMDEVDGMSSGDRGGMQELIKIIENSQVPIICCCNDDTHDKVRALKKHCLCLPFILPHVTEVKKRILEIAKIENMTISAEGIEKLHTGCNGDLRQMITSLQMWSHSGPGLSLSGANVVRGYPHWRASTRSRPRARLLRAHTSSMTSAAARPG